MEQKALASAMSLAAIFLRLAIACLIVFAGIAMFQDRLLYFPDKASQADIVSGGLQAWPGPQDFRGLLAEPNAPARETAASTKWTTLKPVERSAWPARMKMRVTQT